MGVKDSLVANGSKSKAEIKRKREEITDNAAKMNKITLNAMPEDFWIQYYQTFFEKNEDAATRFVEEYIKQHKVGN